MALCNGLVDRLAREIDARAVFVKGPLLNEQRLRSKHVSADVDVWIEPTKQAALLEVLGEIGWTETVPSTSATVLARHSVTVRHPVWGHELDVHTSFPGFLAPDELVFAEIWTRATTLVLAHRPIRCPQVHVHAVVAALHWLRDGEAYAAPRIRDLAERVRPSLDDATTADLREFVNATGCAATAAPFLAELGLRIDGRGEYDLRPWRIRTASSGLKSIGWVYELRSTPLRRWPARIWHALVLTEAEIRHSQPNAAPGRRGLFVARLRRLRQGLRDLPRALRLVLRESTR